MHLGALQLPMMAGLKIKPQLHTLVSPHGAHWIQVNGEKWDLCTEVIGFRFIRGDHGGENIGGYLVGMFDRMGITGLGHNKVSILLVSIRMGLMRWLPD